MKQRARLAGGQLVVRNQPQGGVAIICSVPKSALETAAIAGGIG